VAAQGVYAAAAALAPAVLMGFSFAAIAASPFVRSARAYHAAAASASAASLSLAAIVMRGVMSEGVLVYRMGGWPPPIGIVYEVDALGAALGLLTASVLLLATVYSAWYLRGEQRAPQYYALLAGLGAGLLGILYTGDVFNLFVMIELAGISSYALVSFDRWSAEAAEAAVKYSLLGLIAGLVYFLACVLVYSSYGTLTMGFLAALSRPAIAQFAPEAQYLVWGNLVAATALVVALCAWVFTFLSGVLPNHFWLPDAHPAAPTPVSAVLSGLVVNAGVYAAMRLFYTVFGVFDATSLHRAIGEYAGPIIGALSAASMVYASLMMAAQRDVKRLVAYSTIVHTSLAFAGLSLGTAAGLAGWSTT